VAGARSVGAVARETEPENSGPLLRRGGFRRIGAKDFLTGEVHGRHMPNNEIADFFGRPFPVFVQPYLGALKSWMLMPAFSLFGINVAVLRATNLCGALVALLLFMLATWRWLGVRAALIAGAVLATDPTYFFLGVLDWGAAVPSFVCRCACFYLIVLWWRQQRAGQLFFAAFFAGLGFFNKIDFAVLLIGSGIAGIVCYGRVDGWSRLLRVSFGRRSNVIQNSWAPDLRRFRESLNRTR